jgi:hypothetical protein
MSKKSKKSLPPASSFGLFRPGELIPLKGVWFRVAQVETGLLILTADSLTGQGKALLEDLQMKIQLAKEMHGAGM